MSKLKNYFLGLLVTGLSACSEYNPVHTVSQQLPEVDGHTVTLSYLPHKHISMIKISTPDTITEKDNYYLLARDVNGDNIIDDVVLSSQPNNPLEKYASVEKTSELLRIMHGCYKR